MDRPTRHVRALLLLLLRLRRLVRERPGNKARTLLPSDRDRISPETSREHTCCNVTGRVV